MPSVHPVRKRNPARAPLSHGLYPSAVSPVCRAGFFFPLIGPLFARPRNYGNPRRQLQLRWLALSSAIGELRPAFGTPPHLCSPSTDRPAFFNTIHPIVVDGPIFSHSGGSIHLNDTATTE